jgi:type I restriction enzyme S subunit
MSLRSEFRVGITTRAVTFGQDCKALIPHEFLDPEFFALAVKAQTRRILRLVDSAGHGTGRLPTDQVKSVRIPIPPLREQRAIARALRTVQRSKEQTEQVSDAAQALKRSLAAHLFTYGSVRVGQTGSVALRIEGNLTCPSQWAVVSLAELLIEGPRNGLYKPASEYGQGAPIVRINDFGLDGDVVVSTRSRVRVDETELARFGLRPFDLLVNRVNSLSHLGKVAMVSPELREPMVFESNMMRLTPDSRKADPEYLLRYLASPATRGTLISRSKRAVAQSSINQGDVESLPCPVPPLNEQHRIVRALAAVDRKLAAERQRTAALDTLFSSLLSDLMTARLRVDHLATEFA